MISAGIWTLVVCLLDEKERQHFQIKKSKHNQKSVTSYTAGN